MKRFEANPLRFSPGDHVFVRGWPQNQTGVVTAAVLNRAFPHWYLVDEDGQEWLISQLELSSRPIDS